MTVKVTRVTSDSIEFNDGTILGSYHEPDCCSVHYLDFSDLSQSDFDGLEFDLESEDFFNRIEGYGIDLVPLNGHTVKVPGYGSNNGYYSTNLFLTLTKNGVVTRKFDVEECQDHNSFDN